MAKDWGDLFTLLAKQTSEGRVVILFDEISWMGSKDPTFLGKLKNAWDLQFSKNNKLLLIICGSVSSWIEKNIISSTEFLGRPSLYLHLEELHLEDIRYYYWLRNVAMKVYRFFGSRNEWLKHWKSAERRKRLQNRLDENKVLSILPDETDWQKYIEN
jgi:hypothetical protein